MLQFEKFRKAWGWFSVHKTGYKELIENDWVHHLPKGELLETILREQNSYILEKTKFISFWASLNLLTK